MLQNAYFLAKIGADTAENEQHFAENLPKTGCRAICHVPFFLSPETRPDVPKTVKLNLNAAGVAAKVAPNGALGL